MKTFAIAALAAAFAATADAIIIPEHHHVTLA